MVRCGSLILAAIVHLGQGGKSHDHPHDVAFFAFIQQHGRSYQQDTDEYEQRRQLFRQRSEEVEHQNSKSDRLWTATINHLSDWTEHEKKNLYGYVGHATSASSAGPKSSSFLQSSRAVVLAEQVTWDNVTNIDQVDDQRSCGSCWAVAASKMLETNFAIHNPGKSRSFSIQEIVDCVPNLHECGGTGGCQGGTVELAMLYISQRGLATREKNPYHAHDQTCVAGGESQDMPVDELATPGLKSSASNLMVTADRIVPQSLLEASSRAASMSFSWERLEVNSDHALMQALTKGSVAVSADAGSWSQYGGGVFNSCKRDAEINHAILAIGYGKDENGVMFWNIQNSWGGSWGEKGRIKLLRQSEEDKVDDKHCGIDHKPLDGTGCKGGPAQVKVCGTCGVLFDNVIGYPKEEV